MITLLKKKKKSNNCWGKQMVKLKSI